MGYSAVGSRSFCGECVEQNHQAMLFINRRGYSTFVSCRSCGYVDPLRQLRYFHDVPQRRKPPSLPLLRRGQAPANEVCPAVRQVVYQVLRRWHGAGRGTAEFALPRLAATIRLDTDTVRTKDAMQHLLGAFSRGEATFLVGTQMIAKGHDFPNVTLVGVVAADSTLMIPDYRSTERTFQLLTQVAGPRGTGRKSPGRVVIQTYSPGHPAIRFARTHDYKNFYAYELEQRKKAVFPPFSLFVRLLFSGEDETRSRALRPAVRGGTPPRPARIPRQRKARRTYSSTAPPPRQYKRKLGVYRYQILIKLLRTAAFGRRDPNDLYVRRRPPGRSVRHGRGETHRICYEEERK